MTQHPKGLFERLVDRPIRQHLERKRPVALSQTYQAKHRLKWDEALPLQVALAQRRRFALELPARPRRAVPGGLLLTFSCSGAVDATSTVSFTWPTCSAKSTRAR